MTLKYFLTACFLLSGVMLAPQVRAADTLCPDIAQEKNATPGDVAGVQADIERLNLCVERARLLRQLDELAGQRAEMLHKITGDNGGGYMGNGAIPPLPISALPSLPPEARSEPVPKNLKAGEIRITNAVGSPLGGVATTESHNWRVRKIWGQGAGMHAQLTDGTGTLLNVLKGDPLPDGKVVEAVSIRGVTVSQNSKINDLSWDDLSSSESANAAQATP